MADIISEIAANQGGIQVNAALLESSSNNKPRKTTAEKIETIRKQIKNKQAEIDKLQADIDALEDKIKAFEEAENQKQLKSLNNYLAQNNLTPVEIIRKLEAEKALRK